MAIYKVHVPRRFGVIDIVVFISVFGLLYAVTHLGASMNVAFSPEQSLEIGLDPMLLPYYAGRSLMRMFLAFAASLVFTLVYGYIAARNKTAGRIMVPLLDILQSVPVLGFLSITITAFMGMFSGSLLGVELASIFAIFTGQAWNMTFSFYNSLITIPKDLREASSVLGLNWWQRFIKLEVPFSMIGLVWNSMMSFGGGWFFLAASEAISVLGENIRLPGVGSYMATAVEAGDMQAIIYSIITMIIMIIVVDQLFWRPLVVWTQKFKMEMTAASEEPTSFVFNILSRSLLADYIIQYIIGPVCKVINIGLGSIADFTERKTATLQRESNGSVLTRVIELLVLFVAMRYAVDGYNMLMHLERAELWHIFMLGFLTLGRVMIALLLGAMWAIPVGVWIGMNPRMARIFQPVVQVLASFPANMIFPFLTVLYIKYHISFEWGAIPLMMLGTQWYILFNVIAGAMAIPNDLQEAGVVFKLTGWQKWKRMILPAIFPYLITGAITASGGAWNASIVSELVIWRETQLQATGLGAYINQVTASGDWSGIIAGISVMCLFVVAINHFVWRNLYGLAETKYHLD